MDEKITKQEAIQKHRSMWNWIAEQIKQSEEVRSIRKLKRDYVCAEGGCPMGNCYLCEYTDTITSLGCKDGCPLIWSNGHCLGSEYTKCIDSESWQEQYEFALKVANLEERKEKES